MIDYYLIIESVTSLWAHMVSVSWLVGRLPDIHINISDTLPSAAGSEDRFRAVGIIFRWRNIVLLSTALNPLAYLAAELGPLACLAAALAPPSLVNLT